MKISQALITFGLVLQSGFAVASTDPAAVTKIDGIREGNLAAKTVQFIEASKELKGCEDPTGLTTYTVYKIDSASVMDEKVENSSMTYNAGYMALAVCNTGSTYSGAYREVTDAVLVSAKRVGHVKYGGAPLVPSQADQFKVLRHLNPKDLNTDAE